MLLDIAIVKNPKFCALVTNNIQIKLKRGRFFYIRSAAYERFAYRTDDGTLTSIMRIMVVADAVTANEESLIFHRPGTSQYLPGILTTFWPVGYGNDGIVLEGV